MNVALRPVNILSICTGGGGLDLGVELAIPGARSVCVVEREAFAVAQLVAAMEAGHLAPAPVWSDARTFDGRAWRGAVDGLVGGIPCQPHSLAGRKQGQRDQRDLWSDARRIIVQSGVWFVLIENVAGMLSAGADEVAGAERVWRDLRKLGFAVEGGLFTAAEVSASHERERIFILGVADPGRSGVERWGGAGDIRGETRSYPREGHQRQRHGHASRDGCEDVAHPLSQRGRSGHAGRQDATDAHATDEGSHPGALVHAERPERRTDADGRHQRHGHDAGRDQTAGRLGEPSSAVVNATVERWGEGRAEPEFRSGRRSTSEPSGLFPPGPSDLLGWRDTLERAPELEPAFRRVADGLASRMDIARVDRLRLLGNGVVPLEAAYAIRTLVARLARRGSAGAAELARMMAE